MHNYSTRRIPTTLLLMTLMILSSSWNALQAEEHHLIPQEERQQLSDFYRYLRSRYGKAPDERLTENETPSELQQDRLLPAEKEKSPEIPAPREKESPPEAKKKRPPVKLSDSIKEKQAEKPIAADQEPAVEEKRLIAMSDSDTAPPAEEHSFAKASPAYYRGIYINNALVRSKNFGNFLKVASQHGINTLVIDIQPHMPSSDAIKLAEQMGFYLVARVVVFEAGLKSYPAPKGHIERIVDRAEEGARVGFAEIQLDYIRFADNLRIKGLTISKRYTYISSVLTQFEKRLKPYRVRIGADLFGRIAFNRDDIIGQKLEVFDRHIDVIYPMLYPSHFYGDPVRRRKPYQTIFDGTLASKRRVNRARIVPYIQAFSMSVGESGLTLENYIRAQLDGALDSGGSGYIAWNARNDYSVFFRAIRSGRLMPRLQKATR